MRLIDLHCDTLYKSVINKIPLDDNSMEVQPVSADDNRLQCYAIWSPDDIDGETAELLFHNAYRRLNSECLRCGINLIKSSDYITNDFYSHCDNAFFTVENGLALNEKIENISKFAEMGVKMMTLTWNGHNPIGDGAEVENAKGITDFGKTVIKEMEKNRIVVDVSHASDELFYDVSEIATRPFVASHSNSRSVTNHRRNLTDEQIKIIKLSGGVVGLNFHNAFLNKNSDQASIYDIIKHIEHFLSIGGEDVLCIGSDFDGGKLPKDIEGSSSIDKIFELLLHQNYKESLINKIFYENALKFYENFDNQRIM